MCVCGIRESSPSAVAWAAHPLRDSDDNHLDGQGGLTSYCTGGPVAMGGPQALDRRGHNVEPGGPALHLGSGSS